MTFLKWLDSRYGSESNQMGQLVDAFKANLVYPTRARSYKTIRKHVHDANLSRALDVAYGKYRESEARRTW